MLVFSCRGSNSVYKVQFSDMVKDALCSNERSHHDNLYASEVLVNHKH